jgi:uncharacterized SAM-binding protein YcdF (DUF218 family)
VLRLRVEAALAFGQTLDRPLYVPTGGVGRHGPAEAEVMARMLRDAGVADEDILPEPTARDTLESVRAVKRLLAGHAAKLFAASSRYHQARCVLLLRMAGFDAEPCPVVPQPTRAWRRRWFWRAKECVSLPWDVLLAVLLRMAGRF